MSTWYIELSHPKWTLAKLQAALRAWFQQNATLFGQVPVNYHDWSQVNNPQQANQNLAYVRETLTQKVTLTETQILQADISHFASGQVRLHLLFNTDKIHPSEWTVLNRQLAAFYQQPQRRLTAFSTAKSNDEAKQWETVFSTLPAAPLLSTGRQTLPEYHYTHQYGELSKTESQQLEATAAQADLSVPVMLLTLMTDRLQEVAQSPWFRINLTLLNRLPLFPYQNDRASYATTLTTLPVETVDGASFLDRAHAFDASLKEESAHLNRGSLPPLNHADNQSSDPSSVVFTCEIDQSVEHDDQPFYSEPADILYYQGFQPKPDFLVDVWEIDGSYHYRWSFVPALMPAVKDRVLSPFQQNLTSLAAIPSVGIPSHFSTALAGNTPSFLSQPTQLPNWVSNAKATLLEQKAVSGAPSVSALQLNQAAGLKNTLQTTLSSKIPDKSALLSNPLPSFSLQNPFSSLASKLNLASQLKGAAIPGVSSFVPAGAVAGLASSSSETTSASGLSGQTKASESLNRMVEELNKLSQTNFNPATDPEKTIPPITPDKVNGLSQAEVKELCEKQKLAMAEEDQKNTPAADSHNQAVLAFYTTMDASRQYAHQEPYVQDFKQVDENLAATCKMMLTGQMEQAKQKMEACKQSAASLQNKFTQHPFPALAEDPLTQGLSKIDEQQQQLQQKTFAAAATGLPLEATLAKLQTVDNLSNQSAQLQKAADNLQSAADADYSKLVLHAGANLQAQSQEQTEKIAALQEQANQFQNNQQAALSDKIQQAQAQTDQLKQSANQILSMPCPVLKSPIGTEAINQFGQHIQAIQQSLPLTETHQEILEHIQAADDQVTQLQNTYATQASEALQNKHLEAAQAKVQALHDTVETKVCQKDVSSLLAGRCGTKLEHFDPYRQYIDYAGNLKNDLQSQASGYQQLSQDLGSRLTVLADARHQAPAQVAQWAQNKLSQGQNDTVQLVTQAAQASQTYQNQQEATTYYQNTLNSLSNGYSALQNHSNNMANLCTNLSSTLGNLSDRWEKAGPPKQMLAGMASNSPITLPTGNVTSLSDVHQLARQTAYQKSQEVQQRLTSCAGGDPQTAFSSSINNLPSQNDVQAWFNPQTPFDPKQVLSSKTDAVQSKLAGIIPNAPDSQKGALTGMANQLSRTSACLSPVAVPSLAFSKAIVVMGASAKCKYGKIPSLIKVMGSNGEVNGLPIAQNSNGSFTAPFGFCSSPKNPPKPPAVPISPCIMPPVFTFTGTTQTYLVNGEPALLKASKMGCPLFGDGMGDEITIVDHGQKSPQPTEAD